MPFRHVGSPKDSGDEYRRLWQALRNAREIESDIFVERVLQEDDDEVPPSGVCIRPFVVNSDLVAWRYIVPDTTNGTVFEQDEIEFPWAPYQSIWLPPKFFIQTVYVYLQMGTKTVPYEGFAQFSVGGLVNTPESRELYLKKMWLPKNESESFIPEEATIHQYGDGIRHRVAGSAEENGLALWVRHGLVYNPTTYGPHRPEFFVCVRYLDLSEIEA